jgi:drug/metabolite transporter (DMT)-like permease
MLWFYLSLICAVSVAIVDALSKRALGRSDPYVVAWVRLGYCIPFLAFSFIWIEVPELDAPFFRTVLVMLPLEIAALILYTHAIRQSPLSLTIPFLALTPLFLIATAFGILQERPDGSGVAGIVLIAAGAYLLNVHTRREGWLAPIRAILRERGSRNMIVVAFLYSITSVLGKVAIQHSSPAFFGVVYFPLLALASLPFLGLAAGRRAYGTLVSRKGIFTLIGLVQTVMILTHVTAVSLVEVPYMIAIKRTSLLFAIVLGWFFFRETHIRERFLGSLCMLAGVVLILI